MLRDKVRIDGRGLTDIRTLSAEVEVVPRVHGSALFERGETQILGVTTLNMLRMEQQLDTLSPETRKRYMHNYNFPPYSTGETGRVGSPKRREIGHGALAERALIPVLPSEAEFPYAIRQVSEALGSNGSTSMGSVCASTMSLLNAGVPLKAPVAGIAMGLISDEVDGQMQYVALTDILGAEDAFGDMDFKVAGTKEFVTALQLDTKLDGIPASVLGGALTQAHDARLAILDVMNEAIDVPDEMSVHAPRIITVKIPVDKIGEVIGPKGKMINQIQDETGAEISIEDDGTIYIGATDGPKAEAARAIDQRDRQPADARGGRALPRHGRQDRAVRRVRLAAARPRRPAAHQQAAQARRWQAGRERRGRRQGRSEGARSRSPRSTPAASSRSTPSTRTATAPGLRTPSSTVAARHRSTPATRTRTLLREADGGLVRRSVLPGGLRVITEAMPGVRSVAFGVWVDVGSRDETPAVAGSAHFLEHLLFKGTPSARRPGHLGRDRRGGRRDERLHHQGVHVLLRTGTRRRSARGGRRDRRHGRLVAASQRRRGVRA